MVPDGSLQGAVIPWLQQLEQDACWVLWVKLPACGLHPTVPDCSTGRQGASEGHFSCTRLIKGLFQLPDQTQGRKGWCGTAYRNACCSLPLQRLFFPHILVSSSLRNKTNREAG